MADDGRPRKRCPVCGEEMLVAVLLAHVGSARCGVSLLDNRGRHFDSTLGPLVLRSVRRLMKLLGLRP